MPDSSCGPPEAAKIVQFGSIGAARQEKNKKISKIFFRPPNTLDRPLAHQDQAAGPTSIFHLRDSR